jgi:hypothetical protein
MAVAPLGHRLRKGTVQVPWRRIDQRSHPEGSFVAVAEHGLRSRGERGANTRVQWVPAGRCAASERHNHACMHIPNAMPKRRWSTMQTQAPSSRGRQIKPPCTSRQPSWEASLYPMTESSLWQQHQRLAQSPNAKRYSQVPTYGNERSDRQVHSVLTLFTEISVLLGNEWGDQCY